MTDYWLSKLFYDLQRDAALAAAFRADRAAALAKYPLDEAARRAVIEDDVPALAARVNPYLLRYYFSFVGMKDAEFIRRLRAMAPQS